MFRSFPSTPLFLCGSRHPGILFVDSQSSVQRMFLLERASRLTSPCWADSRASHQSLLGDFPWVEPTCNFLPQQSRVSYDPWECLSLAR